MLAAASAAAFADDLRVPRDHRTVEDALEAASPGDRVIVQGGTFENIHVRRGMVEIVARGTTVKGYVWIDASQVSLSGLRLGPNARVVITGDDVTVSNLRATGRGRRAISVQGGDRTKIVRNKMSAGDIEVLFGSDATIERNKIAEGSISANSDGAIVDSNVAPNIGVTGDGAQLVGNDGRWINCTGDDCDVSGNRAIIGLRVDGSMATVQANENLGRNSLTVSGNSALVLDNDVTERGITVWGDDAVIVENDVSDTHVGIEVIGERFTISENQIEVSGIPQRVQGEPVPTDNPAIRTFSDEGGSAISGNEIEHFASPAIDVTGNGVLISGNDLHGIAAGTSILMMGNENVADSNLIEHTQAGQGLGDGIVVVGDANVIGANVIDGVPLDAILVWSGHDNVVDANDIDAVPGCGIVVTCGAFTTTVTDCNVEGCLFGVVNEGSDTSMSTTITLGNAVVDILDLSTGFETFNDNTFTTFSSDRVIAPVTSLTDPPVVRMGPITRGD